jgi:hypothetical protein
MPTAFFNTLDAALARHIPPAAGSSAGFSHSTTSGKSNNSFATLASAISL